MYPYCVIRMWLKWRQRRERIGDSTERVGLQRDAERRAAERTHERKQILSVAERSRNKPNARRVHYLFEQLGAALVELAAVRVCGARPTESCERVVGERVQQTLDAREPTVDRHVGRRRHADAGAGADSGVEGGRGGRSAQVAEDGAHRTAAQAALREQPLGALCATIYMYMYINMYIYVYI